MDHMMPGMDGIKATKILRASGYTHPVVALTANAISGQAEMFLANGFDRFISKPIDSRELDLVLTELIRNRKPPEVIEAARRESHETSVRPKQDFAELKEYFIQDAEDIVKVLENVYAKIDDLGDADIESYTIAAHGIKSALRNIGETTLSELAFDLERAGRARNLEAIAGITPVFIKELKTVIAKTKLKETNNAVPASGDTMIYLKEKVNEFRTACKTYDTGAAETVLNELVQKNWSQEIDDAINEISLSLLHGEFEKAVSIADRIAK
jgi:CheY-like chemotaxis protein